MSYSNGWCPWKQNVYGHSISTMFDNQPNRLCLFRVMVLYLNKFGNSPCPLSSWNIIHGQYISVRYPDNSLQAIQSYDPYIKQNMAYLPCPSLNLTVDFRSSWNLGRMFWHNFSNKLDNQPNIPTYFTVMEPKVYKNGKLVSALGLLIKNIKCIMCSIYFIEHFLHYPLKHKIIVSCSINNLFL